MKRLLLDADLVEVSERPRKKTKNESSAPVITSPSYKLLQLFTPITKQRMQKQFAIDDKKIENHESDLSYHNYLTDQEWGKKVEEEICAHGQCPSCQSKLHLCSNPNFPAVDLKCEKCHIWFQVKASFGSGYFSLKKKFISVGSKKYGTDMHESLESIIGYICVKLNKKEDYVIVSYSNSFVLVPSGPNSYKYSGVSYFGSETITWDNITELGLETIFPSKPSKILYKEYQHIPKENLYRKFLDL
jgi:hypothetical protein